MNNIKRYLLSSIGTHYADYFLYIELHENGAIKYRLVGIIKNINDVLPRQMLADSIEDIFKFYLNKNFDHPYNNLVCAWLYKYNRSPIICYKQANESIVL